MQDAGFLQLHAAGFAGFVVVVAAQVQGAVDHQVGEMMGGGAAGGGGLAADGAEGKHNVAASEAAHWLEGEDVGGLVAAAMAGIQQLHGAVGGQDNGPCPAGRYGSACGQPVHETDKPSPGTVLDKHRRPGALPLDPAGDRVPRPP